MTEAIAIYRTSPIGSASMRRVKAQGFVLPDRPNEKPELPEDLSLMDSEAVIHRLALLTSWTDYAEAQVGLAVIAEREAERRLEVAQAEFWQSLPEKMPVTTARIMQALDPGVRTAQRELDEAYAYRRLVTDVSARYERDAQVVSREITRRNGETSSSRHSRRERWAR